MDELLERLTKALNAGKRRGYEKTRKVDGVGYLFEYAIKKGSL